MNPWLIAAFVVMVTFVAPALFIAGRGEPLDRMVGLEMVTVGVVMSTLLMSQGYGSPSYFTVPLLLTILSVTGTLVYTRLLGPRA